MKALNNNAHPLESLLKQHCPNGVEFKELGELFTIKNGYTPSKAKAEFWEGGTIPWFRMEDIQANGRILKDSIQHITPQAVKGELFPANSIIISTTATIGEHALVIVDYLSNQQFTCLIPQVNCCDKLSMRFMFYYGFILGEWCRNNVNKSAFPSVKMEQFKKVKIPIPPIAIQQKIVEILDAFTELQAELQAELHARRKQYEYYRNKLLSFEELEKRANAIGGLKLVTLGEVCEILDNLRKPITKSKRIQGIYPYYGANGIQDYVNEYIFDGDFLLIGEDGSVINKDNSPVLNWASGKFWVNNHAHILKEKSNTTDLRFVFFYLQTCDVSSIVRGVPPKINQQNLKTIQIPLPPLAVQNDIVEILDKFDTLANDLSAGLPAEIEARQKQYEHYREQLLSFKEKCE